MDTGLCEVAPRPRGPGHVCARGRGTPAGPAPGRRPPHPPWATPPPGASAALRCRFWISSAGAGFLGAGWGGHSPGGTTRLGEWRAVVTTPRLAPGQRRCLDEARFQRNKYAKGCPDPGDAQCGARLLGAPPLAFPTRSAQPGHLASDVRRGGARPRPPRGDQPGQRLPSPPAGEGARSTARSFCDVGSGDHPAIAAQPDSPRLPGERGQRASVRADPCSPPPGG